MTSRVKTQLSKTLGITEGIKPALGFGVWEMGFEVPSGAERADWGW